MLPVIRQDGGYDGKNATSPIDGFGGKPNRCAKRQADYGTDQRVRVTAEKITDENA